MAASKLLRLASLSLVLLTVICWAYQSTLVKLTKVFDAAWTLWAVVTISFVVYLILILWSGRNPLGPKNTPTKVRWMMVVEPCFEVLGYGCVYYAMQNAPLGDAVTLWDMDVIWTAILFSIVERRCLSWIHGSCIVVAIVGIVLVCQPEIIFQGSRSDIYEGFPHLTLGYVTAFGSGVCFTFMFVFVARLQQEGIHWTVIEFNFVPLGLLILPLFTWGVNGWTPPENVTVQDWFAAVVIAALDIMARLCATFALQVESPPLVSLIATLEIPFSYLFSYVFTGEVPNYLSGIGAGLIFVAIVVMGTKDFLEERNEPINKGETAALLATPSDAQWRDPAVVSPTSNRKRRISSLSSAGRRGVVSPYNSIEVA